MTAFNEPSEQATESAEGEPSVVMHDLQPDTDTFQRDVLRGLSQAPKRLPSKYFYDARGCELFERICELDEYYPTRTEIAILQARGKEISDRLGPRCQVIEYGSGSGIKTRLLLSLLRDPVAYVPVDIARDHLRQTAWELTEDFPELEILPVCADFTRPFDVPPGRRRPRRRVVYFPGSTIGNLEPPEARQLLAGMAHVAGRGGGLLIGVDLKKDVARLEAAYNDRAGVTARFNLNLLRRINRELGGDFRLDRFRHHAWYHAARGRIEMHLVSEQAQTVHVAGRPFAFAAGESICTEYSHKYDLEQFAQLARQAGWTLDRAWTDDQQLFAIIDLAVAEEDGRATSEGAAVL